MSSKLLICFLISFFYAVALKAEQNLIVQHLDKIEVDRQLSLPQLVEHTLQRYPEHALIAALQQESNALQSRGRAWISGAPQVTAFYKGDEVSDDSGFHEFEGAIEIPLWNWGQREAAQMLAEQSHRSGEHQLTAIRLTVAGLVREALWRLKATELKYEMGKVDYQLTEKLFNTIQRRVQLGDLAQADLLLMENELLTLKTDVMEWEAELMHARKDYSFLTQIEKIPAEFSEQQTEAAEINENHPLLAAKTAEMETLQAEVEWVKKQGSGQPTFAIGGVTERGSRAEASVNSMMLSISAPFGGERFAAPEIAAAHKAFISAKVARDHLLRSLIQQLHEIKHAIQVDQSRLQITRKIQANAQQRLKMAELSFSLGEIDLVRFLRTRKQTQQALKNTQLLEIRLQQHIALYNQTVGVMP